MMVHQLNHAALNGGTAFMVCQSFLPKKRKERKKVLQQSDTVWIEPSRKNSAPLEVLLVLFASSWFPLNWCIIHLEKWSRLIDAKQQGASFKILVFVCISQNNRTTSWTFAGSELSCIQYVYKKTNHACRKSKFYDCCNGRFETHLNLFYISK